MYHIERCAGPCAGLVDHEQYAHLVEDLGSFLAGDTSPVVDSWALRCATPYEPRVRAGGKGARPDRICAQGHRTPADGDRTGRGLGLLRPRRGRARAAVQVFYVRRGRVVGRKGFIVDKVEDLDPPQLLADIVEQHYADAVNGVPPLILVPGEVDETDVLEEWLSGLRASRGR